MYLEKHLNIYFHEQMFFHFFVAEEDTGQYFLSNISFFSLLKNLQVSLRSWF